ncbi:MAG: hypothetical protein OXG37_16060 [Actinomycetia bacterium]|nr:hypothetical protein [Actinomycetes bacterium]
MAYFSLTVLEGSARHAAGATGSKRTLAANHYQIEREVLDRVGRLSSQRGGQVARRAEGRSTDFTPEETRFLEAAVTAFTRRVAEKAADPGANLPMITMADLLRLST